MSRGAIPGVIPIVMLALIAASAISLSAHGRGFRGHGGARVSLAETLALTDDQQDEMAGLKESFGEARQALRESHRAAFLEVLTEEQVATLDEIHESGSRRHYRGSLLEALVLTQEQQEALAAVREAMMAEKTALRDDRRAAFEGILTEEQLALLEEIKASRPAHGRCDDADEADGGDTGEVEGAVSTEAAAVTTSTATAVEDQSWGQVKRGFK